MSEQTRWQITGMLGSRLGPLGIVLTVDTAAEEVVQRIEVAAAMNGIELVRDELTWTCHVCGDERPDAMIGVRSKTRDWGGLEVTENVRYCRDRPACGEGAESVTWMPEHV